MDDFIYAFGPEAERVIDRDQNIYYNRRFWDTITNGGIDITNAQSIFGRQQTAELARNTKEASNGTD